MGRMLATQTHTEKCYSHVNYCNNSFSVVTNPSTSAVYWHLLQDSVRKNGGWVKKQKNKTVCHSGQKVAENRWLCPA